jgi:mono/diheme cytochrome c family protein
MKVLIVAAAASVLLALSIWALRGRFYSQKAQPRSNAAAAAKRAERASSPDPVIRGEDVYYKHCLVCHSPDTDDAANGPSLKNYFRRPPTKLSNGKLFPRTDAAIRDLLVNGTRNMPPMIQDLTEQQTADMLAYLHTL